MEMRLRPEQLLLLGILAAGLALLGLQLAQDWRPPDLRHTETPPAGPEAEGSAAAPPPGESPEASAGEPARESSPADVLPAPSADSHPAAQEAGPEPPPAEEAPLPPNAPGLDVRAEPSSIPLGEPLTVLVTMGEVLRPSAISFEITYDPQALSYDEGMFSAMSALSGPGGPPEIAVEAPQPGRLVVNARRSSGETPPHETGDLFAVQFTARQRGPTRLRVARGQVSDASGARTPARGGEISIEVR